MLHTNHLASDELIAEQSGICLLLLVVAFGHCSLLDDLGFQRSVEIKVHSEDVAHFIVGRADRVQHHIAPVTATQVNPTGDAAV